MTSKFCVYITPPSKIKIKNYDTWPTLHVSKLKTKPQCICILTAQLHKFCALKVRQCAFFPQDYSYLSVLANENHLPTLFKQSTVVTTWLLIRYDLSLNIPLFFFLTTI